MRRNMWLVAAGLLSATAALLHLVVIVGGPEYYRFFGAGEGMARAAEAGSMRPALITIGIALVLFAWSAFAFSGARLIPRLPLLRTGLIAISFIYLARGLILLPILLLRPWLMSPFVLWSSLIVLVFGLVYAVGTWIAWRELSVADLA